MANNIPFQTMGKTYRANITTTTVSTATWTIREYSGTLYFQRSGSNIAKLDSAGNFTTIGNVTAFGTI
jgi:hypothetical protein